MKFLTDNLGTPSFYMPTLRRHRNNAPDVVFIQGFGNSPRAMNCVRDHLIPQGYSCEVAPLGGLLGYLQTRGLKTAGKRLAEYLLSMDEGPQVWLIGHSMGGLIARWAVQQTQADCRVKGVITIGTPHKGTPAAIAGLAVGLGTFSHATYQIVPFSPTIRKLNNSPWPENLPLHSIVSTRDPLCIHPFGLLPFENSPLIRSTVLRGLRHTEMLRSEQVLNAITSEIKNSEL